MIGNANDGCLDIASIVRFELSPFSDILVNVTVWDPNLKVFSGKFLKAQGLGNSAIGRSDKWFSVQDSVINARRML